MANVRHVDALVLFNFLPHYRVRKIGDILHPAPIKGPPTRTLRGAVPSKAVAPQTAAKAPKV